MVRHCHCFFFKQKTAYEIKECDWSSDVCSSDLVEISTNGLARASTSNGSIDVTFKGTSWADTLVFETSNGNITLGLPADLNAKVEAQTQTGNIKSAFS